MMTTDAEYLHFVQSTREWFLPFLVNDTIHQSEANQVYIL